MNGRASNTDPRRPGQLEHTGDVNARRDRNRGLAFFVSFFFNNDWAYAGPIVDQLTTICMEGDAMVILVAAHLNHRPDYVDARGGHYSAND